MNEDVQQTEVFVASSTLQGPGSDLPAAGPLPAIAGYELLGVLGRGGMGLVYKARHLKLNRLVALKMIRAGDQADPQVIARFLQEARTLAQLQHPHIVQIHEIGEQQGQPFFSLELVEGGSLAQKLVGVPQPSRAAAGLVETLARAVQVAHEHGIVHRDLKPANVLLTTEGIAKITDFGLAKQLEGDSGLTRTGAPVGTPSYMSLEQALGQSHAIGPATDVYALGAILYEMLTGRPPFRGTTLLETLQQVRTQEPIPPSRLQPKLPRDLETICLKCLQKAPPHRYPSAAALADDLHRFLAGEPVLARPIPSWQRGVRWCARNPRMAALLGTVALLLVILAAGSLVAAYRISNEKAATEAQKELAERNAAAQKQARQDADRNALLAQKNAEQASKAQEVADQQARLALGTVYDVVTTVDAKLQLRADMGPLRKELLQLVMKRLDQISKDAVTSAHADRTMGVALQRMAIFYNQMGMTQEQIEVLGRSLRIFERLMREYPNEDWNRFDAAVSYDELGEIAREIEPDPSRLFDNYNKSLQLRKALMAQVNQAEPSVLKRKRALVTSYIKLATLALVVGDPLRARNDAREAVQLSEALATDSPALAAEQREILSSSLFALARADFRLGDEASAREHYRRCMELRSQWAQADGTNAYARQEVGRTWIALGELEMELRHGRVALENYQQAQDTFAALARKDPGNPEIQWYLANATYGLGTAQRFLGDKAAAEKSYRACLKTREILLKEDPKNPQRKIELMLVRARLGQNAPAAALAGEVQAYGPRHPGWLFAVGGCYALCSQAATDSRQREVYAQKAIAALRQAIDQGYRDLHGLTADPDLEPLRDHPAYPELLTRLARK